MAAVSETSNDQMLAALAATLADGVEAALPPWVEASVRRLLLAFFGVADDVVLADARIAGEAARDDIGPRLRVLLDTDPDEQWTNPLSIVRAAVVYPTTVLRSAGVPAVVRDPQAEIHFPDDAYDLTPTKFADLAPALHEPSMAWGAAKAFIVKSRHQDLRS
jgi:hypothetical protein